MIYYKNRRFKCYFCKPIEVDEYLEYKKRKKKEVTNMKWKFKKFTRFSALNAINTIALFLAVVSVNSTCVWVHHQPRVPSELQLKRKINEKSNQ